jgi:hypothetical protein
MIRSLPPFHLYLHDVNRNNFTLYIKLKISSTALTVDCRHSAVLNFVSHKAAKARHIDMHACHTVMDLMSLATFVGQSSTIKNDTVTKTRLFRVNIQNERMFYKSGSYKQGDKTVCRHGSHG